MLYYVKFRFGVVRELVAHSYALCKLRDVMRFFSDLAFQVFLTAFHDL